MLLTLQLGLAALRDGVEAALVVLGDQPQIETTIVESVIAHYTNKKHLLVVPSFQMQRGHPWLVAQSLWDSLLALKPPATMRQFLGQFADVIHYVNVENSSILQDLDTPEDYERFNPGKTE
jgi:molybdenum cofactor cytidylyltransferase